MVIVVVGVMIVGVGMMIVVVLVMILVVGMDGRIVVIGVDGRVVGVCGGGSASEDFKPTSTFKNCR